MSKQAEFQKEQARLAEIFKNVEPAKAQLVEGLIDEAAYLRVETAHLRSTMVETGMIKIHPQHKGLQKPTEAAKQYLKNVNSFAVVIKTLNGILQKDALEDEDPFDQFLKERKKE